jgi:hypothetical protein
VDRGSQLNLGPLRRTLKTREVAQSSPPVRSRQLVASPLSCSCRPPSCLASCPTRSSLTENRRSKGLGDLWFEWGQLDINPCRWVERYASLCRPRAGQAAGLAAGLILVILLTSTIYTAPPADPESGLSISSGPGVVHASVVIGANTANESSAFWGVDLDGTLDPANHSLAATLNATPFTTLRYGADWADQTNWETGRQYTGSGSHSANYTSVTNNVADFAKLCQWIPSDRCYLGVPAEIDNVTTLLSEVNWLYNTTHWAPTCWAIGNEPQDWDHFDEPWVDWLTNTTTSPPTPTQFAGVVHSYTLALRSLNHNACIVGIESDSNVGVAGSWIQNVTRETSNVTEVAVHDYPDGHCAQTGGIYPPPLPLADLTLIQHEYSDIAVPAATVNGTKIPVDVHEFSIGLDTSPACIYVGQPVNAVFASAVIAQALSFGDPQLAFFRYACGGASCMLSSTLSKSPVYNDYSDVLSHMDVSRIYNVTASGTTTSGTFMVLGAAESGLNQSLLVVNANANTSALETVNVSQAVPVGWHARVYCETGTGSNTTSGLPSNATITLGNATTCVVQAGSPCSVAGCGVGMLAGASFKSNGVHTVGPINATQQSLLYLAISQDYDSGGAPTITDSQLTWTERANGSHSGDASLWIYTSTVPAGGVEHHTFSIKAGDGDLFAYIIMDFPSFSGFDLNLSSVPSPAFYSNADPSVPVSTTSEAASFVFVSTIAATGDTLALSPHPGEDVFNSTPSPSYAVSCILGVFPASDQSVGGTLSATESGWIVSGALDLTVTGNSSLSEIASVNDATGNRTLSGVTANSSDLLYLGVTQDYSGGAPPVISDSVLEWNLRDHETLPFVMGTNQESFWTYTATVPNGGISSHTLYVRASDSHQLGIILVDIKGVLGFDPNGSSILGASTFSGSRTPSTTISTNSQSVDLAFVGLADGTGPAIGLSPDSGEEVFNDAPTPAFSVSLLFAKGPAGSVVMGGTLGAMETGGIISDALDLPNSGNPTVVELSSGNDTSGTSTISGLNALGGDLLYLVVAQDSSSGGAPTITDSLLDWTVRSSFLGGGRVRGLELHCNRPSWGNLGTLVYT